MSDVTQKNTIKKDFNFVELNCKNKYLLELLKFLYDNDYLLYFFNKDIKSVTFFDKKTNNIYGLELKYDNLGIFSLSSKYEPTTGFGSGSSIGNNELSMNDVFYYLENGLPKNYFLKKRGDVGEPIFYKSIQEYINNSYFELFEVTKN